MKYNQSGEVIEVAVRVNREADCIEIIVMDDGDLIPEEQRDILFDAFTRGDQARKSDGGTGLGLAITKAITKIHGGMTYYQQIDGKNCFITQWKHADERL